MSYTCKHFVRFVSVIARGPTPSSEQAELAAEQFHATTGDNSFDFLQGPRQSTIRAGFRGSSGMGTSSATGLPLAPAPPRT